MITLVLLAALALAPQETFKSPDSNVPVPPEQVLAWQLEGLTGQEIREELETRGLTERPEDSPYMALPAAGANAETIRAVREAKAPRKPWKLGLRLPGSTDYLYEIVAALLWNDWNSALLTIENEAAKQRQNPDVHLIYAQLAKMRQDWITAYGQASETPALAPELPSTQAQRSTVCYYSRLVECAAREAELFAKARPKDACPRITGRVRGCTAGVRPGGNAASGLQRDLCGEGDHVSTRGRFRECREGVRICHPPGSGIR